MSTPVQPPAAKTAPPQQAPRERPKPENAGNSLLRPVKHAWGFVRGTVRGLLDGIAHGGRKGLWLGMGIGIMVGVATTGIGVGVVLLYGAYGFIGGALLNGAVGGLLGGVRDVKMMQRKEKYASDIAERNAARSSRPSQGQAPAPGFNYQAQIQRSQAAGNVNFALNQRQDIENDRDYETFWQDQEAARNQQNFGRGH